MEITAFVWEYTFSVIKRNATRDLLRFRFQPCVQSWKVIYSLRDTKDTECIAGISFLATTTIAYCSLVRYTKISLVYQTFSNYITFACILSLSEPTCQILKLQIIAEIIYFYTYKNGRKKWLYALIGCRHWFATFTLVSCIKAHLLLFCAHWQQRLINIRSH